MHEPRSEPAAYPGTEALAQVTADSTATNLPEPADDHTDVESVAPEKRAKGPSLTSRLNSLTALVKKIPNPAQILPKKSHRVAAASGLSTAALGVAAAWSQFFGGDGKPSPKPDASKKPAATSTAETDESTATTTKNPSPPLSITPAQNSTQAQFLEEEPAQPPLPVASSEESPQADQPPPGTEQIPSPVPTPIASAPVPDTLSTPPLDDPNATPDPTDLAPLPFEQTTQIPPSASADEIIVPPPTLLAQEAPAHTPEGPDPLEGPPGLLDPDATGEIPAPTPLAHSEPPLPVEPSHAAVVALPAAAAAAGASLLDPPPPSEHEPASPITLDQPPPDQGSTIPTLAATPDPSPPIAQADPIIEQPPAFPEMNQADMVALPNSGPKLLSLDKPVGEPRPFEPAPVALASAAPITGGAQAQLAITDAFEPVLHVVQSGENFWSISRLYYGSGRFYKALWKANSEQFRAPEDLHVGAKIKIPPPEALDRSLIEPATASEPPANKPQPAVASDAPTPAAASTNSETLTTLPSGTTLRPTRGTLDTSPAIRDSGRVHVVASDTETLRSVARDELGDSRRDDEIRSLNLDILEGRTRLVRGMRLRLPADPGRR